LNKRGRKAVKPSSGKSVSARAAGCAVAPVGLTRRRVLAFLIAQVCRQFSPEHPFHQLDPEIFHKPGITQQIFRPLAALQ
jgi:hypothetical protein